MLFIINIIKVLKKYIFIAMFTVLSLLADTNKTKELEGWLKFGFTNGDIAFIAEYIRKIEIKNSILEKRIANLEKSILKQNQIIKSLLTKNIKSKKQSIKKDQKAIKFKPAVFITKNIALLYDMPNGKSYMKFPPNYKFTAYEKIGGWIRVSGHFPAKKWRKMQQSAWIKQDLVKKIR